MIKNQLVIYRTFATQQYIFHREKYSQEFIIPISPLTKPHEIESNIPYTISENKIQVQVPKHDVPIPIHEISQKEAETISENIEIIIKYPTISWKSFYTFYKNSSIFTFNISIINNSKINFETRDIKLVFRSIDHEYIPDSEKGEKARNEFDIDIPSMQSTNLVDYELKCKLDEKFILKEYFCMKLWSENVNHSEIYQVDMQDEYQKYTNSFIKFKIPEMILPGHLEMYDRNELNDIYSIGSLDVKLYRKGDKMKILYPKNKMLKLKNHFTKSSHSFFLNKTHFKFESKMKKLFPITSIVHFYIYSSKNITNFTKPFSYYEDNHYIWEHICEKENDSFILEFDIE